MIRIISLVIFFIFCSCAQAIDSNGYIQWLKRLKAEAKQEKISSRTIKKTFKNAKFLPRVIALDRSQPEFISTFLSYIDNRVTPNRVDRGRALMQANETMLAEVEAQYNVPKTILVAFWGLETNYGSNQGDFSLPSALMTLAYEGRRADFFRTQLLDAMRIVDAKHNTLAGMRGSWAGAMGHMQFMPSTFIKYGVDADADGKINIWSSLPDAFASAANYLAQVGWRKDEPVMIEVKLPASFDYSLAQINTRKSSEKWSVLGVRDIKDQLLPELENAAIILPQGWQGPAFMVFSNFDVIMDWNRSVNYALSVAHLSNQLVSDQPIVARDQAEGGGLSFNQMWALQGKLNELGFDCGPPDGFPGLKTQEAIRQYQAIKNLPQDGYASPSMYQALLQP